MTVLSLKFSIMSFRISSKFCYFFIKVLKIIENINNKHSASNRIEFKKLNYQLFNYHSLPSALSRGSCRSEISQRSLRNSCTAIGKKIFLSTWTSQASKNQNSFLSTKSHHDSPINFSSFNRGLTAPLTGQLPHPASKGSTQPPQPTNVLHQ